MGPFEAVGNSLTQRLLSGPSSLGGMGDLWQDGKGGWIGLHSQDKRLTV